MTGYLIARCPRLPWHLRVPVVFQGRGYSHLQELRLGCSELGWKAGKCLRLLFVVFLLLIFSNRIWLQVAMQRQATESLQSCFWRAGLTGGQEELGGREWRSWKLLMGQVAVVSLEWVSLEMGSSVMVRFQGWPCSEDP